MGLKTEKSSIRIPMRDFCHTPWGDHTCSCASATIYIQPEYTVHVLEVK